LDIALGDIILVDLKEEKSEALREVANEIKDDINNIDSLSDETKNFWMRLMLYLLK
jgi:pyruvate-formate lyase-activating enzyme